ncbi:type III-A CRISPR-associated protein Cas10/Csm1 [Nitratiruptor tergarcus]|uniref:CRISPR system single-strand-specific deoxyribonuclease Cas10/Csm1 (subtype III-A) n=1 Tax=Nitratiruptor tergarcus DSM 16512 TaxID=1069081 RepID=A0A1W1WTX6_9BACT|nr:type III-A CRISPR-associated protein Cas10/Csm1 [Nitratiruptor tergarcus]SMC09193.1 CRISPR-associated protein Cas10/Csm1, subtype III-A/MTUBE [Nitratiruptor tergarcus DSM 16512]
MRDVDLIALAGLLHDIGKFRQRTGKKDLDDHDMTFALCNEQKCSYIHAAHTSKAIEEMGLVGIENLVEIASSHHENNLNDDKKIIQLADRYASAERKEGESSNFKKTKLMSIFSEVALCNENEEFFFPVQKFTSNIAYPNREKEDSQAQEKYQRLYNDFKKDAENLQLNFNKEDNFLEFLKIKSLLEKYTTFIPSSSYRSYPDVSLFDHLLLTSALSVALKTNKDKFYLIQGDFTSIQSFIFSKFGESNKFLAKILRAKSLFVSLSTEYIALKICKLLQIPPTNIVLSAGGKFTIIAPKYEKVKVNNKEFTFDEFIEYIKDEINKQFATINYLQTKFALTFIEEKYEHLQYNNKIFEKEKNLHCQNRPYNASCVFWNLAKSFEEEKLKFDSNIEVFEDYIEEFKSKEKCDICGIVPTTEKIDDIYICKFCKKFKEIGEKFTKKKYIQIDLSKDLIDAFDFVNDIQNHNLIYFSMDENDNFAYKRVANYVPLIEDENDKRYKLIEEKFDERLKKGDVKSFYHIAVEGLKEEDDGFYGRKYLAILKADVDNLGQIFIYGFKKGKNEKNDYIPIKRVKNEKIFDEATFSRIMSLSRFTDFYFTSILKKKIKEEKEEYKNIYTVFAGGDDLFLIGHYEEIIALHKELIIDFKKFTQNSDFHLSYAIKFISANVPIMQMAEFAEEDLNKAKDFNKNNSVIFGIKVSNEEVLELYALEDEFKKMDYLSESFLYKVYTFIDMQQTLIFLQNMQNVNSQVLIENARWKALFNYYLKNSVKDKNKLEQERKWNEALQIADWIEKWGEKLKIPLNLYLYSKRKYKKD